MFIAKILLGILIAIFGGWQLYGFVYNLLRKNNRPPLVVGYMPWLGIGLQFGKDFLETQFKKYGESFQGVLGGKRILYLSNPADISSMWREKNVSFEPFVNMTLGRAFDAQVEQRKNTREEIESEDKEIHSMYHVTLQRDGLVSLTNTLIAGLRREFSKQLNNGPINVPLFQWSSKMVFLASIDSIFGEDFLEDREAAFVQFRDFDNCFTYFLMGLPDSWFPSAVKGRTQLTNLFRRGKLDEIPDEKQFYKKRLEIAQHYKDPFANQHLFSLLWATQANTAGAVFWLLYHTLTEPGVFEELKAEVVEVLGDNLPLEQEITMDQLKKMVKLDSCLSEVLRMDSTAVLTREVTSDTLQFKTAQGKEYTLHKGEQIAALSEVIHYDSKNYENPQEFKYDRFLKGKNANAFIPFGGGKTHCPGRFFAANEMKLMIVFFVALCDVSLKDTEHPGHNPLRTGSGIYSPKKDPMVEIKWKSHIQVNQ